VGRSVACVTGVAVLLLLCAAGIHAGLAALLGRPVYGTVDFITLPLFVIPLVASLGAPLAMLIRSPHWVRLSAAGVEIGTTNARAVLIPWSNVESATVCGRSVLAHLDVVPRRAALNWLQDTDDQLPPIRIHGGRRGYTVQVGLFPSGAGAIAAALRARGVPQAHLPVPTVSLR
jgi:hypothetical protein